VRAAQTALLAEFEKRDPAHRAGSLVEPGEFFSGFADGEVLREKACHCGQHFVRVVGRWREKLMRALFAQVEFVGFAIHQIGNVERGLFIALLAFHVCGFKVRANQSRPPNTLHRAA
jgi:hypothetical protein